MLYFLTVQWKERWGVGRDVMGAGGLATCTVYQIIQRSGEVCHLRCASSTPTDCDSYDCILVTTS